jgi:hypothetical protein
VVSSRGLVRFVLLMPGVVAFLVLWDTAADLALHTIVGNQSVLGPGDNESEEPHMKRWQPCLLMAALMLAGAATGSAQIQLRPGEYEITLDMNLPVPREVQNAVLDAAGYKKQRTLQCITAEDAKGAKDIARFLARELDESNCTMSEIKTTGNKMTYSTTCVEDDIRMTMNTELTTGPDSFTSFTTAGDNRGQTSTVKATAKRIGECRK